MSERGSESLLSELRRNLEPVRRIPRLRVMLLAALGAFALTLGADGLLGHPLPLLAAGVAWADPAFLFVLWGLLLMAGGGIVAALAGAVPGRERVLLWGVAMAGSGFVVVATAGGLALLRTPDAGAGGFLAADLECASRASLLGVAPAVVVCAFLGRAFERRPLLAACVAAVGALALGAAAVHASCAHGGALHVLLGHWLAPFAAGLLLSVPLSLLVRGLSRRS